MAIKKAYKNLALTVHPDKNPDCVECVEKFERISKAYDTLSNPEKRKAYDSGRKAKGNIESASSVDLDPETYESMVLRSNEVWFVQVYDPADDRGSTFGAAWEEMAHKYKGVAKFGRVDVSQPGCKEMLPSRYVIMPVVLRLARGQQLEVYQYMDMDEDRGHGKLKQFIEGNFPQVNRFKTVSELESYWSDSTKPRAVIVGPSSNSRAAKMKDWAPVLRLAHMWSGQLDFASVDAKEATQVFNNEVSLAKGNKFALVLRHEGSDKHTVHQGKSVAELAPAFQEFIHDSMLSTAPFVTTRNYQQLCTTPKEEDDEKQPKKTYCLFLVNADDSSTADALKELAESRKAYAQEVEDLKATASDAADGGSTEEMFRIQPVRVATSTSRLPWRATAVGSGFKPVWAATEHANRFVLEIDSRKVAGVRLKKLTELYQQIAYEDLKLEEMEQDWASDALTRMYPDPEMTLRRELVSLLSNGFGAVMAYIFLAFTMSVVPELELPLVGALGGSLVAVVAILWPAMSRRSIAFFWCMTTSAMECQRNY
eukprot:TRINITY_DN8785_c2_g1_i1.p1 TRINITY_DN8785_c2_g1~~TRINITY_DN8785_c2_g1_i1.p1  ORF type:complete len:546 (-),score=119.53 TRINITY_DN8785_c2_g1_i1:162-1778(-)